eukprot:3447680-Amphidinium_carterae.1
MNHLAVPPQQCQEGGHAKRKVVRLLERQHKETMLMVPVLMPIYDAAGNSLLVWTMAFLLGG